MSNRREFLKQSLICGTTFALAGGCRFGRPSDGIDPAAIAELGTRIQGQLILPEDAAYEAARRVNFWNPTSARRPGIIARCTQPDDIARCIEFARRHDAVLAVRGGGHSFLGWGTCDDGLVIDLSPMKTIAVDSSSRTVRAGPGVVAHELVAGTSLHELVPVLGQCATVGISGLTLGGGLGWLSGKYGATCDNLLSAELISADGESIVANSTENSDLFWAIRGGGGNFGVVTSFEYRLHPLRAVLAGVLTYSLADAPAMLRFYRDFMAEAPDELQAVARLAWDGDPVLNVVVCFSGHPNDGEQIIRPLRTRLTPVRDTMRSRAYSGTFTGALLTEAALETSAGPKAFQHIKGCYLESLSDDAIDVVLDRLAHAPGPGARIGLDHYMHGAVCRVARDSTAFELRQPGALHIWIVSGWSDPAITAAMVAWSEETWNALQSYSGGRVYANYPNAEGESAARAVYGGNYSRLLEIKKKYDPSNVFQQNQNLRPTLG